MDEESWSKRQSGELVTTPSGGQKDRVEELRAAAGRAKQRFNALREAFDAMERAHQQGDYSPSPDLQLRMDEFRGAAAEVHRVAREMRAAGESGSHSGGPQ